MIGQQLARLRKRRVRIGGSLQPASGRAQSALVKQSKPTGQRSRSGRPGRESPDFNARGVRTFSPDVNGINGSCLNGTSTGNFCFNALAYDCANVTEGEGIPLFSFGNS